LQRSAAAWDRTSAGAKPEDDLEGFSTENRREAPAIRKPTRLGPSSNFDTNPAGMQRPSECPKGVVLLRISWRRWKRCAYGSWSFQPWNGPVIPEQATDLRATNLIL
jgi:hypothetical protein